MGYRRHVIVCFESTCRAGDEGNFDGQVKGQIEVEHAFELYSNKTIEGHSQLILE